MQPKDNAGKKLKLVFGGGVGSSSGVKEVGVSTWGSGAGGSLFPENGPV